MGHTVLVVHRVRRLAAEDVTTADGIRVTTFARTALDLAETLPRRQLLGLLDRADDERVFDLAAIEATIARNPGRRGITPLREALELDVPDEEDLQRRFLRLCRSVGIPEPPREVRIGPYHVDFPCLDRRLAVETDGRAWHDRRAAFDRDRERDLHLAAMGIRVVRVT